ncbi:Cys-tRNA(Pro) deacylase [Moraxella nasovis]|uniref:Cys-tRNA(Pro) deacylase n=1 Tax=Moraxella nasovis TaxID=2904121 RepID=UPI001F61D5EC|nr:Cys-tRNA(Pro) deacylase [Moraxella nasovis]UNU73594.1 Cys-tRNA(Pro) deacylase [Moraxella nasovis]
MTPATKLLKKYAIDFSLHEYDHDPNNSNFGQEAVDKLGLSADVVFKTLLVCDDKSHYVAVLPVSHQLSLRKLAKSLGVKKVQMAQLANAERITGYIAGGISPIAQKKRLKTVVDKSAQALPKMYISGGRRGLDIGISPSDLAQILGAAFCDIVDV